MQIEKIKYYGGKKMAFKLCPKCLHHYIKDDEIMCSFCKISIKNNALNKTKKSYTRPE